MLNKKKQQSYPIKQFYSPYAAPYAPYSRKNSRAKFRGDELVLSGREYRDTEKSINIICK